MQKHNRKRLLLALGLLLTFVLWTVAVQLIDIQPVGPESSSVGLASINAGFHSLTGVHMGLYHITDWLGLVPFAFVFGFGILGLCQWIKRKSFCKVDGSILVLGSYYILVMAVYILFEYMVINYRPVLIGGYLEASYPSSTTMLVLCVMPTTILQFRERISNKYVRFVICLAIGLFTAFMVIGRLISGVHWLSDIIGGVFLSAGLVALYNAVIHRIAK